MAGEIFNFEPLTVRALIVMPNSQPPEETHEQRLIRLLTRLAEANAPIKTEPGEPMPDVEAFAELVDGNFISGKPLRIKGEVRVVIFMSILPSGRALLAELKNPASKPKPKTDWGMIGALIALAALIITVLIYYWPR